MLGCVLVGIVLMMAWPLQLKTHIEVVNFNKNKEDRVYVLEW
jgi:hypothetical protein